MLLVRRSRPARPVLRPLASAALAVVLTAVAAVVTGAVAAPAAHAAGTALKCLDTLYLTDSATGQIRPVDPTTGTVGTAVHTGTSTSANQVGVSKGGAQAIYISDGKIVEVDPVSGATSSTTALVDAGVNKVAGAINLKNGLFYYGGYDSSKNLVLWVYDPATDSTRGPVASITAPGLPGTNGDLAFDADGILYFVASSTETTLYRLGDQLPTGTPKKTFTAISISTSTLSGAANGIAFGSDGFLYLGQSTMLTKVNPVTGKVVTSVSMSGVTSTDLASCAGPSTLTVAADLGELGRVKPTDQFTIEVVGGDYDGTPAFPSGTTTGTDGGVQDGPGETAGKAIVLPGDSYTATLKPAGTTDLDDYTIGYRCVDTATGQAGAVQAGTSMPVTVPTGTTGATTSCSFVVGAVTPRITVDATVTPTTFTRVGQELTWTYEITNAGNVDLDALALGHTLAGLSAASCTPVALGQRLDAGESTTCTATSTVTAAHVAASADLTDTATASGTPVKGNGSASASDAAAATNKVVGPTATNDAVGTPYATAVALPGAVNDVRGSTDVVAADTVLVHADATDAGHRLVTTQGTWTVRADGDVRFEPAAGFVGTTPSVTYRVVDENGLTSTATLAVTVRPAPTADADRGTTKQGVDVVVDLLHGDEAGPRADGSAGALDPASVTLLPSGLPAGAIVSADGRTLTVAGEGVHTVAATTGRLTFRPEPAFTGTTTPVTYRVTDQAGNTATATIEVTVTAIVPVVVGDGAKTRQGQSVVVDVLANDAGGDPTAPLDAASVRLTSTSATAGGTSLVVDGEGTWTVRSNGSLRFTPESGFTGTATPVRYSVADRNGTRRAADVTVVVGQGALAAPDHAATPQATAVGLAPLSNDVAGDLGRPCSAAGTPSGCDSGTLDPRSVTFTASGQPGAAIATGGKQLTVLGEGTWTIDPAAGTATFQPAASFHGTTSAVTYAVEDSLGNRVRSTMTVRVRPIVPVATDDECDTAYATPVDLVGAGDDTPGTDDHDTPSDTTDDVTPALVLGATVFPSAGQPSDAALTDKGRTLAVPAEGRWTLRADGTVRFVPADGFTGTTTRVAYRVEDVNGTTSTATLRVRVRPGPVAVDDAATTAQDTDVTLKPLGNDTPGQQADGSAGDWAASPVRLRTSADLPAGSVLTADQRTLTVPGQGVWRATDRGAVVLDPEPTFAGDTAVVPYAVTDSSGNSAWASLTVTVVAAAGHSAPSTGRVDAGGSVTVDVLSLVTPAVGAKLVPGSVCLLTDTVLVDGDPHPVDGAAACVRDLDVDTVGGWGVRGNGAVTFTPGEGFSGVATVEFSVRDTAGNTYRDSLDITVEGAGEATDVLPAAGGPALGILAGGALLVVLGAALLRWRREV
ncbi:Ig-like domain-containing protein [Aeromicrobium sp. IC_218]|uniref:Ig-like domain-containing protein n=1 Tax=Aeromicrobium sp. IC_218 TaxID=2545468 RepID=UPI00103CDE2B|nr:Ig-like domain-containing protein [Aeromicrobium sp. IC_218]TCI98934.1 hypothetical protein E0W78_09330 [Aeromicrobium sp. IC_218]